MNSSQTSIPGTPTTRQRWIVLLLGLVLGLVLVFWMCQQPFLIVTVGIGLCLGLDIVLTWAAWRHGLRWLFTCRALRIHAWLAVSLVSVIVLFYGEENWRGKRAWSALLRETAARRESLEVSSLVPPNVPDDQNFVLAPKVGLVLGYGEPLGTLQPPVESRTFQHGHPVQWPKASWMLRQPTDLVKCQDFVRRHAPEDTNAPTSTPSHPPPANEAELAERRERLTQKFVQEWTHRRNRIPGLTFPVTPEPQTPAADLLFALSRYDADLAVLRAASQRPQARYPVDYAKGWMDLHNPNTLPLETLYRATHILALRASAELAQDQAASALEDIRLGFRLADTLRNQPFEAPYLYRGNMLLLCLQPVWEGLGAHRLTEPQLADLQQRLAALEDSTGFQRATRGETLLLMDLLDQIQAFLEGRQSTVTKSMENDDPGERFWVALARLAYPSGWFYQDKVWLYRQCQKRSDLRRALALREWAMRNGWGIRRIMDPFMVLFFVPKVVDIFQTCTDRTLFVRTGLQQAQTACALERYRLAQGQYPATLDALVPAFLTQVPIDALNPATVPLKYQLQGTDHFILYSFGLNQVDDKGQIGSLREEPWSGHIPFARLDEGDWVWGSPEAGKGQSEARSSQ